MKNVQLPVFQNRIFGWQRDVAGQPVTLDGDNPDMSFYPKQLSFVESEWFDEYLPNSFELQRLSSEYTITLRGVMTLVPTAIDSLRMDLADDIGDVAFTLFGLLNVLGHPATIQEFRVAPRHSISFYERNVTAAINSLKNPREDAPALITNALVCLHGIASIFAIDFFHALEAVCVSNDTKLWTADEINTKADGCTVTKVDPDLHGIRCYRVVNANGKLVKSPSFQKPNLVNAIWKS